MTMVMKGRRVLTRITLVLVLICIGTMRMSWGADNNLEAEDGGQTSSIIAAGAPKPRPPPPPPPAPVYDKVDFQVVGADEDSYGEMIAALRRLLSRNMPVSSQGIATLPESSTVPDSQRYVLLVMSVGSNDAVTFAINVVNVYMVAYHVRTRSGVNMRQFFQEAEVFDPNARRLLFTAPGTATSTRNMSSNYLKLEQAAGQTRRSIHLGLPNFDQAIRDIISGNDGPRVARALIVTIQMVAEAVRFGQFERMIQQEAYTSFIPNEFFHDLLNSWQNISTAVQTSIGSSFLAPLEIDNVVLDNTNSLPALTGLVLMLFVCQPRPPPTTTAVPALYQLVEPLHQSHDGLGLGMLKQQVMSLTRRWRSDLEVPLVVAEDKKQQAGEAAAAAGNIDQCRLLSPQYPRTRITGRDGLCVDVSGFTYRDNNPVVVFTCRTSDWRNQQWTWRPDGRIMSLEKCLTASGNKPGSAVVIRECDILDSGSPSRWRMDDQGNLIHIYSRLALTAAAATATVGGRLTLESRAETTFQAWTSTNQTVARAHDIAIVGGQRNRCIYYNGNRGVYTEPCATPFSPRQRWRLYPDSSIRPVNWLNGCMQIRSLNHADSRYNYIQAGNCGNHGEYHRWIFTSDGAIQNLRSRLVVDEDRRYTNGWLQGAIFEQSPNQIWRVQLIP